MRQIKPYKSLHNAKIALDNGGRFYDLFTRQDDRVINSSELARTAGVFTIRTEAVLFFEMSLAELPSRERVEVISMLSPDLRQIYAKYRPVTLAPSAVEIKGRSGKLAMVSGYSRFVEDKTQFNGLVMVPVMAGEVITFMLIPVLDQFDVYEVFDTPDMSFPRTVIATLRGRQRLETGSYLRFGGILKQLTFEDAINKQHGLFLDALYYSLLS